MRVGRGDAERLRVSRPPPHPPQCAHWGTFPPVGGRLLACSNREGFCPLWDVWIHILGIRAECACGGGGRPSVPPLRRRRGKPGRRVREAAPYKRGGGGKPPPYGFPEIVLKLGRGAPWGSRREHAPGSQRAGEGTRPYSVFTNGSTYRKRDRSGTCPLKRRGEAELRTKFLCLLSFSKKGGDPVPPRRVRFLI